MSPQYNSAGQVVQQTITPTSGSEASDDVTTYQYDANGNLTDMTAAAGSDQARTTHYTYYDDGQIETETIGYGSSQALTTKYLYDADDNVHQIYSAYGTSSEVVATYSYNDFNRVVDVSSSPSNNGANDSQPRFVGVVYGTADELASWGVTQHSIDTFTRLQYQFGVTDWQQALGIPDGSAKVDEYSYVTPTGDVVEGVVVTNTANGQVWYGVPEVVYTWKDGFATGAQRGWNWWKSWVSSPESLGTKVVGYAFYKNLGDAEWNLTGGERLKALESLMMVYGVGAGVAGLNAVGQISALRPIVSVRSPSAPLSGAQLARDAGRMGEYLAGVQGPKIGIRVPGSNQLRFPDLVTKSTLKEVKNVAKLSYTQQLRGYAAFAQQNGLTFELWIRPSTKLSGPLKEAILRKEVIPVYIPGTR